MKSNRYSRPLENVYGWASADQVSMLWCVGWDKIRSHIEKPPRSARAVLADHIVLAFAARGALDLTKLLLEDDVLRQMCNKFMVFNSAHAHLSWLMPL